MCICCYNPYVVPNGTMIPIHERNLAYGVLKVFSCFILFLEAVSYFAEEFNHQLIYCKQTKIEVVLVGYGI